MPDQPFTQVSYARRDEAGWITLDRPAQRNALTPVVIAELHRALDLAGQDPAVRALVITGAGPAFCAGADLGYFQSLLDADDGCERFVAGLLRPLGDFLARRRASPAPVIAAVNGACAAGGLELVLCCDLIVAAAGATFTDAPSGVGEPRVLLAAVGPRMTAAACAVADGLIAHPLTSRRVAQEQLRPRIAGAARPGFELSCPVLVITGRSEAELDEARTAVRRQIAFYASTPAYRSVLELYQAGDLADRLRAMSRAGEWDAMTDLIPDDLLREFSVEAPAGSLAGVLHERFDGVLDRIMIYAPYPVPGGLWAEAGLGAA